VTKRAAFVPMGYLGRPAHQWAEESVIVAWSLIGPGLAQQASFDGHGLALAPQDGDPRAPLVVQRANLFRAGEAHVSTLAEYARVDAAVGDRTVLQDLVALNLSAGVAPLDRWRLDVRAPLFVWASGAGQPGRPAIGDVRLTSMWSLVRPVRSPVGLGLVAHVDAPTGSQNRFLGQPGWAGGGRLAFSAGSGPVTLSIDSGLHLRTPRADGSAATTPGDELLAGLALSFGLGPRVGLVVEGTSHTDLRRLSGEASAPFGAEALAALRISSSSGPFVTLGAAAGLAPTIGTPQYRTFVGVGIARRRDRRAPDAAPIYALRTTDLCPTEVETTNGWRDDDGCPDRLGTLAVDVRFGGESRPATAEIIGPDRTREQRIGPQGLSLDVLPGTTWTVRATEGCLTGEAEATAAEEGATLVVELEPIYDASVTVAVRDGSGAVVPEAEVSWRSETPDCVPPEPVPVGEDGRATQAIASGLHTLVVTAPRFDPWEQLVSLLPGSEESLEVTLVPARMFVDGDRIEVLDKIRFEPGEATLVDASRPVLDELAALILSDPEIGAIEVEGHTDSKGSEDFNQQLSQARAEAVRDYLVKRDVPAAQLEARGYGESRPVASNRTEVGRETNRRVTFRLTERAPEVE